MEHGFLFPGRRVPVLAGTLALLRLRVAREIPWFALVVVLLVSIGSGLVRCQQAREEGVAKPDVFVLGIPDSTARLVLFSSLCDVEIDGKGMGLA